MGSSGYIVQDDLFTYKLIRLSVFGEVNYMFIDPVSSLALPQTIKASNLCWSSKIGVHSCSCFEAVGVLSHI